MFIFLCVFFWFTNVINVAWRNTNNNSKNRWVACFIPVCLVWTGFELVYCCVLVFHRIAEYISLDLFYFFSLTSSCSLIHLNLFILRRHHKYQLKPHYSMVLAGIIIVWQTSKVWKFNGYKPTAHNVHHKWTFQQQWLAATPALLLAEFLQIIAMASVHRWLCKFAACCISFEGRMEIKMNAQTWISAQSLLICDPVALLLRLGALRSLWYAIVTAYSV